MQQYVQDVNVGTIQCIHFEIAPCHVPVASKLIFESLKVPFQTLEAGELLQHNALNEFQALEHELVN
jgi:hypothetical protein